MEKKRKILLLELFVILLLIPSVVIYYEWNIARQNNENQMREHAIVELNKATTDTGSHIVQQYPNTNGH